MHGLSKCAGAMIALFAAIPIVTIISVIVWELFRSAAHGGNLSPSQLLTGLFAGMAVGIAAFAFVYAARCRPE